MSVLGEKHKKPSPISAVLIIKITTKHIHLKLLCINHLTVFDINYISIFYIFYQENLFNYNKIQYLYKYLFIIKFALLTNLYLHYALKLNMLQQTE